MREYGRVTRVQRKQFDDSRALQPARSRRMPEQRLATPGATACLIMIAAR
jgi:hypothetical protein